MVGAAAARGAGARVADGALPGPRRAAHRSQPRAMWHTRWHSGTPFILMIS